MSDRDAGFGIAGDKLPLYVEHKWVREYTFPPGRSYILIAYIAYGHGTVKIGGCDRDQVRRVF